MKLTIRIAAFALIAMMSLQVAMTSAYAAGNDRDRCDEQQQDEDEDCDQGSRKKPKFQTKFFSN